MRMSLLFSSAVAIAMSATFTAARADNADPVILQDTQSLASEITDHGKAYDDLRELTAMGPRLAASPGAAQAIQWAKAKMETYGFENITLQPMTTPVWTRGNVEKANITGATPTALAVAALGGSVGTPAGGIDAEVVEVQSLEEVQQLGDAVRGKIVFYNRPMDASIDPFDAYGGAVDQRTAGPSKAARYGAVATLVRSLTTLSHDDNPHTGITHYASSVPSIPAAALSARAASELSRRLVTNPHLTVHLELSAENHGTTTSYNVYGDIVGSEHPEEIVLVGGHLDSWDLGDGAHDDGAGVVQSMEVLRAMRALGLRPKRTIRCVLFMTEEFGGVGARDYAVAVRTDGTRHVAAIESDRGGFAPVGFTTDGGSEALAKLVGLKPYLTAFGPDWLAEGESGTDVEPLSELGAITIGFIPEATHYFDYHHSALDRIDAVDPIELKRGAAAMAILAYALAQSDL